MRACQLTALCTQKWNGSFFVKTTLQTLGLRYQLGHSGAPCPCPQAGPKNFVVFDISGPHHLAIDYCQCGDEPLSNWVQLLRERWFPATLLRPQTVFTFDCLETFHELTLQGKTNLYDYYHTLLRLSDNASLSTPIVSQYSVRLIPGSDVNSTDMMKSIGSLECGGT
jgi:hypothetical protein